MNIIESNEKEAKVSLSHKELKALNNVILETEKALGDWEFPIRMGAELFESRNLREKIVSMIQEAAKIGEARTTFDELELRILNNALNEVCNGITLEPFEKKIGIYRETASELLSQIHSL